MRGTKRLTVLAQNLTYAFRLRFAELEFVFGGSDESILFK
jgi:hypothetical protein